MSIAATMIVQNEEKVIGRCLESLLRFDRVFILDTGSTDGTAAIAKSFKNVSYIAGEYTWADDDAEARNAGLRAPKEWSINWFYTIDADEWLTPNSVERIIAFTKNAPSHILAVDVPITDFNQKCSHPQPRLFRNNKRIGYIGAGHPFLGFLDSKEPVPATFQLDIEHMHDPSPNHATDPERYMRQLNKAIEQDGRLPRHLFYLAREYAFRGLWGHAIQIYQEYLNDPRSQWIPEQNEARLCLAKCHMQLEHGEEARALTLGAILRNPDYKAALLFMAEISWPEHKRIWERFATVARETNTLGKISPNTATESE